MSPIKGLSDRASVEAGFPRLGKLRKGGPRPEDGKKPGHELSYFRFTPENDDEGIQAAFQAKYGEEPRELDVYLPFASIERNFPTWKELWSAGGLQHRCDGEMTTVLLLENGTYTREPRKCPGGCKEIGRLNLILTDLYRAGYVGYVSMETHSVNDIVSIMRSLLATAEARGTEDMQGIGFCLRRVQRAISTPAGNGKRARRRKWMVELVPAKDWLLAKQAEQQELAMARLPAPPGPEDNGWDDEEPVTVDAATGEVLDDTEPIEDEPEEEEPPPQPKAQPRKGNGAPSQAERVARAWEDNRDWVLGRLEEIGVTMTEALKLTGVKAAEEAGTPQDFVTRVALAVADATDDATGQGMAQGRLA